MITRLISSTTDAEFETSKAAGLGPGGGLQGIVAL